MLLLVGSASGGIGQTLLFSVFGKDRQANTDFGATLVRVGDVNGDGVPDLAVSAPDQQIFVFSLSTAP
jgi:hypothetical protein